MVQTPSGPTPAVISTRWGPDYEHREVSQGWEHGVSQPPPTTYLVRLDEGQTLTVGKAEIIGLAHYC
jgi:hypothetical protein